MTTFRAAYIKAEYGSNGVGILLTSEADRFMSDEELMSKANSAKTECGADGEIIIGEWTE